MTITPEMLANLRRKAETAALGYSDITPLQRGPDWQARMVMADAHHAFASSANPAVVLALLDRLAETERVVSMFMEDPHAHTPRAVDAAKALGLGAL